MVNLEKCNIMLLILELCFVAPKSAAMQPSLSSTHFLSYLRLHLPQKCTKKST